MQEIIAYDANGSSISDLVQWDSNVSVYFSDSGITQAYTVHFFNNTMDKALVVKSTFAEGKLKVQVPNELLIQPHVIIGYINVTSDSESKCLYGFKINIKKQPKPDDFIYVDSKDYITLESILEECQGYASAASGSQTKAAASATAAEKSAADALKSQNAAKTSETTSGTNAANAKASQDAAAKSASAAAGSESNALKYSQAAKTSQDASKESETNAKKSADAAKASETAAKGYSDSSGKNATDSKQYYDEIKDFRDNMEAATDNANSAAQEALDARDAANDAVASITNIINGMNVIIDDVTGISYTFGLEDGILYLKDEEG